MRGQRFDTVLRTAVGAVIVVASIYCNAARAEGNVVWPTKEWQTSTPEEQGMESAALAKLVDFGTSRSFDSLLIARHGRLVLDAYYAPRSPDLPHPLNSATKSAIGTLLAITYQDGLLDSFDHRALDFFPERNPAAMDDRKRAITVQNLLDMTSGIDWTEPLDGPPTTSIEMRRSPDSIKFILDRPMSKTPGDTFNYNSGNSQLLSAIITKLTGMSARDYAKEKLFTPLGITTASSWGSEFTTTSSWTSESHRLTMGGSGLSMVPRDMAKIGYLYLRNGEWEGKRLLPSDWVDKPLHATIDMKRPRAPDLRYSNSFWAFPDKHVYMAVGYHCQLIMVFSELDIVAVTTARNSCPFSKLVDDISGAVKSEAALPPNAEGAELLATAIRKVSTGKSVDAGSTPQR
jgi:CubicO group peptidase (beta-lactamase class C family)